VEQTRVKTVENPLRLDRQLCFPLYAASRLMTRVYQPLLAPLGLTYPQYIVLLILWEDAPCAVSHIGARSLLNSNTLTPLLKRLEHLGYVSRTRSSTDERIVEIRLTTAGAVLEQRCVCIPDRLSHAIPYPSKEARALRKHLDQLIAALRSVPESDGDVEA
jgi:DNA-binding MarR family transcriptional regulator